MTKNTIRILACVVLVFSLAFAFASCEKTEGIFENGLFNKHEHSYVPSTTQPTCTEQGYTTYTCECGETYKDNYVDVAHERVLHEALEATCTSAGYAEYFTCLKCDYTTYQAIAPIGHKYEEKVTRYPTTMYDGILSNICSNCGDTKEETIEAVSATLPKVAAVLRELVGMNILTIDASNTELVLIQKIENENGETKQYVAIDLTALEVNGTGSELSAQITFGLGVASFDGGEQTPEFVPQTFVSIFVEGDDVSVAVTENGQTENSDYDITEEFYTYIAEYLGMTYDELVETYYFAEKLAGYLPMLEDMLKWLGSVELPTDTPDTEAIVNILRDAVVSVDEDGYYHFDLLGLAEYIESIQNKTVGKLVDEYFGKGTMTKVETFLLALPMMKVKTLAKSVEAFAESNDLPLDDVYALVNYVVYVATGADFNIEREIKSRYNKTIAEVVVELTAEDGQNYSDAEINTMALGMVSSIKEVIDRVKKSNIDQLYNYYVDGDADPTYSVTDEIITTLRTLDESFRLVWHYSESGDLDALDICFNGLFGVKYDFTDEKILVGAEVFLSDGTSLDLNATITETGANLLLKSDDNEIVSLVAQYNEDGLINAAFKLNVLYKGALEGYESKENLLNIIHCTFAKGEDEKINASLVLNMLYSEDGSLSDETVYKYENVLDLGVSYDGLNTITVNANEKVIVIVGTDTEEGSVLDITVKEGETVLADLDVTVSVTLDDQGMICEAHATVLGTSEGKSVDMKADFEDGEFDAICKLDGEETAKVDLSSNNNGGYTIDVVLNGVSLTSEILVYLSELGEIVENLGVLENLPVVA